MDHQPRACEDFARAATSRRSLLKGVLGVAGAGTVASAIGDAFVQTSYAATGSGNNVLVVLSMRGGADGLSLVVPHGDPAYYLARPRIGVPASQLIAKDGMFGLHPKLQPLLPLWRAGQMAAVHAVGMPAPNRSHFAAMEIVEDADPGSTERRGWINRMIGLDSSHSPLQAVQLGEPITPTSMFGPEETVVLQGVPDLTFPANNATAARRRKRSLHATWDGVGGQLGTGFRSAFTAINQWRPVLATSTTPKNGATYPSGSLGDALSATARVIRADVGAEVCSIDYGNWDMHANLGTLSGGEMVDQAEQFAQAVAAFFVDLGDAASRVTLVTISEFGRRVAENANLGLDHGYGGVMMLFGAGVSGGYHARWPGLALSSLIDGDLAVTTDYRSVLTEVLRSRFGADTSKVFPNFIAESVGAMTAA